MRPNFAIVMHGERDGLFRSGKGLRRQVAQVSLHDLVHRFNGRVGEADVLLGDDVPDGGMRLCCEQLLHLCSPSLHRMFTVCASHINLPPASADVVGSPPRWR